MSSLQFPFPFLRAQFLIKVGGVEFEAFSQSTLNLLRRHHQQVSEAHAVRRGQMFSEWDHGTMVPWGARVPNGGCAGAGYGSYKHMSSVTDEDIEVMFAHGHVSNKCYIYLSYSF
jgi:hypothetical protein